MTRKHNRHESCSHGCGRGHGPGPELDGTMTRKKTQKTRSWRDTYPILALAGITFVAGCTVSPEPMTRADFDALLAGDQSVMFAEQEPLGASLSMEEAMARALKYNLDARVALLERSVRKGQLDQAQFDLLPSIAANAGFSNRSNEDASTSKNVVTGRETRQATTSDDPDRLTADLTMTWNVLDFGVSYYQAKQNADEVLIAEQRQRTLSNQIMQQVRTAYWRAATSERMANSAGPLLREARSALEDAKAAEAQRLQPPLESLAYQKSLMEIIRNLSSLDEEAAIAKAELASLMGLPPGTRLKLVLPSSGQMSSHRIRMSLPEMERTALRQRPEVVEAAYQKRIDALETRKAMLRLLPGIEIDAGLNYDSNSYLVDNQWYSAGAVVTWNLLNLASGPQRIRLAEKREELGDARRLALGLAIMTQVNVGYQEYQKRRSAFVQTRELADIERRFSDLIVKGESATAQSPLQVIRAQLNALNAEVSLYQSYSELQTATANLFMSIGASALPAEAEGHDLTSLTKAIKQHNADLDRGKVQFPALASTTTAAKVSDT